jgi:sec-independent protein translocase protein TatA
MFGSLGFTELILILVIVLIIFGAGKLPQLGEGVGKAIKGFKKSLQEAEAFDVDPQAQAQDGTAVPPSLPQQVSQPIQTEAVETPSQPQPEVVKTASSEPVAAPLKV